MRNQLIFLFCFSFFSVITNASSVKVTILNNNEAQAIIRKNEDPFEFHGRPSPNMLLQFLKQKEVYLKTVRGDRQGHYDYRNNAWGYYKYKTVLARKIKPIFSDEITTAQFYNAVLVIEKARKIAARQAKHETQWEIKEDGSIKQVGNSPY